MPSVGSDGTAEVAAMRVLGELLAGNGAKAGTLFSPQGLPKTHLPGEERLQDDSARHIMSLLKDVGEPKDNPSTKKVTTLEYKGQWQPKPNGAETGHGVVPKDWAIELASETDRVLASFDWAGGAQLCLSNAFGEANAMQAQAQDLIESGTCTEDDAAVQCIRTIAKASEEREALMRRQWSDIDFQQGEEANKEVLRHLERDFAGQLASVAAKQANADKCSGQKATQETDARASGRVDAWYNFKIEGGTRAGKIYLSAQPAGGASVELCGYDDESGRQRWNILPEGQPGSSVDAVGTASWYHLRLAGGTSKGRRLLSRGAHGRVELSEHDDGSGRHRWHISKNGSEGVIVTPASGDPGIGVAASIESSVRGTCLCADTDGVVGLQAVGNGEPITARHRWIIPEWNAFVDSAGQHGDASASNSSPVSKEYRNYGDQVVSIAVQSGSDKAISLKDLSHEQMSRVLNNNRNLGTAIDLLGAYLKNYEIDKADRLCSRIQPLVRERGGIWLFKFLNFFSTVRMKQSRYEEALEMYKEYETLINFSPEEAWEVYDTVYRNYGWIYTSLNKYETALEYFEKAVEVKRKHGINPHWFDQWDLGKSHARISLQRGRPENLQLALKLICEGIEMHKRAEPQDIIMRCKMLNSAGECSSIFGDFTHGGKKDQEQWYRRAAELHQESVDLYMKVLGPSKPLTAWAMEDLAGVLRKLGRHTEAKGLLHGALKVECSKDIIKLPSVVRLLDSVLEVHRAIGDREGLAATQDAINTGMSNLQKRRIDKTESASYALLLEKIADVLLAHDEANYEGALSLLEEAASCLRSGGARLDGMPRTLETDAGNESEREQMCIPHAGQQQMEMDPTRCLIALEQRISTLRSGDYIPEVWTTYDNNTEPEMVATGVDARDASPNTTDTSPSTIDGSRPTLKIPEHFEVIDDIFEEVD